MTANKTRVENEFIATDAVREELLLMAHAELEEAFNRLHDVSPEDKQQLENLAERFVQVILQKPTDAIRRADEQQRQRLIELFRCLFDLEQS